MIFFNKLYFSAETVQHEMAPEAVWISDVRPGYHSLHCLVLLSHLRPERHQPAGAQAAEVGLWVSGSLNMLAAKTTEKLLT